MDSTNTPPGRLWRTALLVVSIPFAGSCGGLVVWVEGSGSSGEGGGPSSSVSTKSSTSSIGLDCSEVDAFDCESKPGCISACLSTPSQGCFAKCRPSTPVSCVKTCVDEPPFCPTGFVPEGDGLCFTGYCISATVCLD
ncbi:MAG: hypothetical protein U0414_16560 [Polyangiaceae bacterium]